MRQHTYLFLLTNFFIIGSAKAQQYDRLIALKGHTTKIYYSPGFEPRTESIAIRIDKAIAYHEKLLGFRPSVTLLVLGEGDWKEHAAMGAVYGMPHYNNDSTLIVAAADNVFWRSFLPPLDQLPPDLRDQVKTVYSTKDSTISMQAFFDLLAIHELGHGFHLQGGLTMQRKWIKELFVNILLHTYIAENEPGSLPALVLFPRMVVGGGTKEYKYTSLQDLEEKYNEIAQKYPRNYGWYQCRWHMAAARIYETAGKQVCKKLWDALKTEKRILDDKELVIFLSTKADKSVTETLTDWESQTKN